MALKVLPKIVMFLALVLVSGCGGEPGAETRSASDNEMSGEASALGDKIIVTSDDTSLPDGCRPREVAGVVIGFVDAFNRGDRAVLNRVFFVSEGASPPDYSRYQYKPWSWYSDSEVGSGGRIVDGFVTFDQGELLGYFEGRHAQGERLQLLKVSLTQTGVYEEPQNTGFMFVLTRRAEDLEAVAGRRSRIASGQGVINCKNRRIFIWTMRMNENDDRTAREAAGGICADPPGWKPGAAVVACT